MYLDAAYIAKFYVNEPDSVAVRQLLQSADTLVSSEWAIPEVASVFHRHRRECGLSIMESTALMEAFQEHVQLGLWVLHPVTPVRLWRVVSLLQSAPTSLFLRAGDAMHVSTALELEEPALWTSDRRLLAAANHFGLEGRCL